MALSAVLQGQADPGCARPRGTPGQGGGVLRGLGPNRASPPANGQRQGPCFQADQPSLPPTLSDLPPPPAKAAQNSPLAQALGQTSSSWPIPPLGSTPHSPPQPRCVLSALHANARRRSTVTAASLLLWGPNMPACSSVSGACWLSPRRDTTRVPPPAGAPAGPVHVALRGCGAVLCLGPPPPRPPPPAAAPGLAGGGAHKTSVHQRRSNATGTHRRACWAPREPPRQD